MSIELPNVTEDNFTGTAVETLFSPWLYEVLRMLRVQVMGSKMMTSNVLLTTCMTSTNITCI